MGLCVFAYFLCVFVHMFGFFSYIIDRPIGGGRLRCPPLINYQFHIKQIIKMRRITHKQYVRVCKNM